jgi:uncharacterized protein (TIGR02246 family)
MNPRVSVATLVTLLLVAAASCQPRDTAITDEQVTEVVLEDVLQSLDEAYDAAFNASDAARLADVYTEDAVVMPADRPAVIGRDAIEADFQRFFDLYDSRLQSTTTGGYMAVGTWRNEGVDWAVAWGTSRWSGTPKAGGDSLTVQGKHVIILRRQLDGGWRIERDIWNNDTPVNQDS